MEYNKNMNSPKIGDTWYRYCETVYSHIIYDDEGCYLFGKNSIGNVKIELEKFKVVKLTPRGLWLSRMYINWKGEEETLTDKKFILLDSRKKFAHPTKEEALESFIQRKASQVKIVKRQLDVAKRALDLGKELQREQS